MPAARVGVAASLLAGLLLGLSWPARSQAETDTDFSPCSHSFYRETPPQGPAGSSDGLVRRCHILPGGRRFASLYNSTCGASVYSALRLRRGSNWGEQPNGGDGEEDVGVESPPDSEVLIPALLGGGGGGNGGASTNPAASTWDELISRLVREAAVARCSGSPEAASTGPDLFVLTGTSGLSQGEDGGCQAEVLWSAVCCATLEDGERGGGGGEEEEDSRAFSLGVVQGGGGGEEEEKEEERVVSVQELAEVAGLAAIFTGFCGEAEMDSDVAELFLETLQALKKELETTDTQTDEGASENTEEEQTASEGGDTGNDDVSGASQEEVMSARQSRSAPVDETTEPHDGLEMENDTDSSGSFVGGALMYLLSSSVSLLSTPVRPVISTVTSLPGQVTYVLGEELAVLSSLPGNTFSLFRNMVCDLCSGVLSAVGLVAGVGELGFSTAYACTAPLVGSLFGACHDGVAGVGQLASDGVGIFGGILDNAWSLSKFFGGTLWDHGEGYLGTVLSELGHQAKTVGVGLGKLLWRGGRGLGNVVGAVGGLAGGTVGSVVENVKEAFGEE
ncbi:hypothetical protein ACEWY4_019547 [Coilia grayii]|uniref:Uncharacterized protein n=1 Tax=Coilia grayii TaxID=363190 RepID=A0ABD1JAD6_9TELE